MNDKLYWVWMAENTGCGAKFIVVAHTKAEAIETLRKDCPFVHECDDCNDPNEDAVENLPWHSIGCAFDGSGPYVVGITIRECAEEFGVYPSDECVPLTQLE